MPNQQKFQVAGFKEIKGDEYVLSLKNLGLSLIDDKRQIEILYVSITSSGIHWGEKLNNKIKVFKAFPTHKIERIEVVYQKYLEEIENNTFTEYKTYMIDEEEEVDFQRMALFSGKNEIAIERHFAPSIYINYFNSLNQSTLHLMIHKLQVKISI